MKIPVTPNNLTSILTNSINCLNSTQKSNFITCFIVYSNGCTYNGEWNSEQECINYFTIFLTSYSNMIGNFASLFDNSGMPILTKGKSRDDSKHITELANNDGESAVSKTGTDTLTIVESGNSSIEGMGEISPIDAVIGDITTPSNKTKNSVSSNANDTHSKRLDLRDSKNFSDNSFKEIDESIINSENSVSDDIERIDYSIKNSVYFMLFHQIAPKLFVEFNTLY